MTEAVRAKGAAVRLDGLTLPVDDVARSLELYGERRPPS
jgi:hypothetical protein